MGRRSPPPPIAVDIPSDDDHPCPPVSKRRLGHGGSPPRPPPTLLVIDDDDPTPQKPNRASKPPSFVAETPLPSDPAFDSDASFVKCTISQASKGSQPPSAPGKFSGITGLICLESDNESEGESCTVNMKKLETGHAGFGLVEGSEIGSSFPRMTSPMGAGFEMDNAGLFSSTKEAMCDDNEKIMEVVSEEADHGSINGYSGASDFPRAFQDSDPNEDSLAEDLNPQVRSSNNERGIILGESGSSDKKKDKCAKRDANKNNLKSEVAARKKQLKEEKVRLAEERKRKRQEEKLQKEAMKAEAAEQKKLEKEKQKWEKGKFAIKSIVAEIDAKIVETGSIGGHLLTRFAEKGLSFRITSNPIARSVLWKMSVPDQISQLSSLGAEVPYVLLVYQAEEFCDLVVSRSFIDHVQKVQSLYPSFTVCFLTNKLMSYMKKCEQHHYKNQANGSSWRRPPVEEVLSNLTTHFAKVHSRQCIDEAELAEHIIGLTSSLANCQFRKKLTQLSVNANGSIIPKDSVDRNLIKKSIWLKALVAIPKVQPRHAIAIWKRYPTMRSLLDVYMDANKSVHEKEFLLKDLMIEGALGREERRFGEICSKRVYRILMAQSGGIKTGDVEDGADFFE